mmetsp:Transcript_9765/g.13622  ORF Transcript_9765/g.13622 Transcript_9765/m.13622 type:complete len:90 (-) Transcript_9765:756-1025(-)
MSAHVKAEKKLPVGHSRHFIFFVTHTHSYTHTHTHTYTCYPCGLYLRTLSFSPSTKEKKERKKKEAKVSLPPLFRHGKETFYNLDFRDL